MQRSRSPVKFMCRDCVTAALLVLLLAVSATRLPAQDDATDLHTASRTELDVVKVVMAQEKAWNRGDMDGYLSAFKNSPNTIFVGIHVSRGYEQILSDYKHDYYERAQMGTLTYSELQVQSLSDSFAAVIGKYHVDRSRKEGGAADGVFTLVLEKTGDGWKIVLDHTT